MAAQTGKRHSKKRRGGAPVVRETLREVRERRALSLSELAELSGVNRASIFRVERGETHPYGHTRRKLAEALKIDVDMIDWP